MKRRIDRKFRTYIKGREFSTDSLAFIITRFKRKTWINKFVDKFGRKNSEPTPTFSFDLQIERGEIDLNTIKIYKQGEQIYIKLSSLIRYFYKEVDFDDIFFIVDNIDVLIKKRGQKWEAPFINMSLLLSKQIVKYL